MLEREKIPELQDVDPNLKPGQDANEVATSVDASSQRRKKAESVEEEVLDAMVAVPIWLGFAQRRNNVRVYASLEFWSASKEEF